MNNIVKMVKDGQKIETKDLFNVVNDFCLTRLKVSTEEGQEIMSMQIDRCEEHDKEYEFFQSCTAFDDVLYYLKKDDIEEVESEYDANPLVDTLYIKCKLKNDLKLMLMIINTSASEVTTKDYSEMDVYELKDFLEGVAKEEEHTDNENGYYCVVSRITDCFGFDLKMNNPFRTYINTLDEDDWKLHIGDDFTQFEVPVSDDLTNEIYIKQGKGVKWIVVKPYNQPFMEISMLFFKKNN